MGIAALPFQFPIAPALRYIEHIWITSVWQFVDQIKGKVHIEESWQLQLQGTNGEFLMDVFHRRPQFQPSKAQGLEETKCMSIIPTGDYSSKHH
jgi:hypothetical protein